MVPNKSLWFGVILSYHWHINGRAIKCIGVETPHHSASPILILIGMPDRNCSAHWYFTPARTRLIVTSIIFLMVTCFVFIKERIYSHHRSPEKYVWFFARWHVLFHGLQFAPGSEVHPAPGALMPVSQMFISPPEMPNGKRISIRNAGFPPEHLHHNRMPRTRNESRAGRWLYKDQIAHTYAFFYLFGRKEGLLAFYSPPDLSSQQTPISVNIGYISSHPLTFGSSSALVFCCRQFPLRALPLRRFRIAL